MGLVLGIDGKRRALDINKGSSVTPLSTLYVGLLQEAPANMDAMDLALLVDSDHGAEFTINANFYSGRQAITLGATMADHNGATVTNNNSTPIEWTNSTGSTIEVAALFITDAASGTSGQVVWVGTPDAGTATIANGSDARISLEDIILRID